MTPTTPTTPTPGGQSSAASEHVIIATGAYTASGTGRGVGVGLHRLDPTAPSLEPLAQVALADPTFVLWSADGSLLYAVQETTPTRVVALRVADDGGELSVAGLLELTGSGGCHLAFGPADATVIVTDYGSGHVEVVGLDRQGLPTAVLDVAEHARYLPLREAHPHQAQVLPGTDLLAVTDLGLDRVYLYRQDPSGRIDLCGEITAPRFSGPRHLVADHESRTLYLACELDGTLVDAVRVDPAPDAPSPVWTVGRPVPASGRPGEDAPSHIELSGRENHVLIANRGPDTLAAFSLGMMRPELVDEIEVGAHPRHFAQLGELVLVAAQEVDRIDLVRWDGSRLTRAAEPVPSASVSCIAPRPRPDTGRTP